MVEVISCPVCQRRLRLPAELQTEMVRCPACQSDFSLPDALAASARLESSVPMVLSADPEESLAPAEDTAAPARLARGPRSPQSFRRVGRSSRKTCLLAFLIVGAIVLTIAASVAGILVLVWRSTDTPAMRSREYAQQKLEQVRQALRNRPPLDEARIRPELQLLFDALGVSLRAADAESIVSQFDVDRMADEFGDLAIVPPRQSRERIQFLDGMRQGLGTKLSQQANLFQWTTSEISKIKKIDEDEVVVVVRHKHPIGATLKVRWWVTRRSGDWKIYDIENLNLGIRCSITAVSAMKEGVGKLSEFAKAASTITEAFQALIGDDVDTAEKKLKLMPANLPPHLAALRQLADGFIHLHREHYQQAIDALKAAKRLYPDMPMVDYLCGFLFNRMGKWEQGLKSLSSYRDLLGDDDDVCREIGEALRGSGRFAEAAAEYRKALDHNPKDAEAFRGFLNSLGGDANKDDVGPRLAKLDDLRENFVVFADDCEERAYPELLELLVQTMQRLDPDFPRTEYYLALVKARTGHPGEAVKLFQSSQKKEEEEAQRKEHSQHFLQVMAATGHSLEAYPVLPEAREAFRLLASEAMKHYRLDDLKALVKAHRQKHADDPLVSLYDAEIHMREGRYAAADKAFTEATARRPDAEVLKEFRASRVLARYHNGQMLSAYQEIGPRDDTFLQLANLCFNAEDDAALEKLLVTHAKNEPGSIDLARYRCRLKISKKDIAGGENLFKAMMGKAQEKEKRAELLAEFLGDMVEAGKPIEGYRAAPDVRQAFELVAGQLKQQKQWDELRLLARTHQAADPTDPWLAYYQGEIHLHEKEWGKAADALSQAIKRAAKELHERFRGSYVYAMYKAGRGLQAYKDTDSHDDTFDQLANLMAADKKGAELEELVRLHQMHAADDPGLIYQSGRAKLLQKKPDEAIALFRAAYQKDAQQHRRTEETRRFLLEMAETGRLLEGFRAVPNISDAFTGIAPTLVYQKKRKELAMLVEEYGKGKDGDPALELYRGELAMLDGNAKVAARHFAAAVAKGAAQDQRRYRNALFQARVDLGEAATVYEQFHKEAGIFDQLAVLCEQKKDAGQLQGLVDVHRKRKPEDQGLTAWKLEVRWLKRDYEGTLRLLTEHRRDVFALPRYQWKSDDRLIRCLVKLKRYQEAIQRAQAAVKKRFGDRFLLVFAYAAAGDVPRTLQMMEKMRSRSYVLRSCFEDADLGPILASEPFRPLRDKFPKPKDETEQRFDLSDIDDE
jgi:tetratricopeptide (TPR) repeat protein